MVFISQHSRSSIIKDYRVYCEKDSGVNFPLSSIFCAVTEKRDNEFKWEKDENLWKESYMRLQSLFSSSSLSLSRDEKYEVRAIPEKIATYSE